MKTDTGAIVTAAFLAGCHQLAAKVLSDPSATEREHMLAMAVGALVCKERVDRAMAELRADLSAPTSTGVPQCV